MFFVVGLLVFCACYAINAYAQVGQNNTLNNAVQFEPEPAPDNYVAKCVMHDNITVYYLMADGSVLETVNGNFMPVGQKERPPMGRTEFAYMLRINTTGITYAVDKQGHVWQRIYPYQEIVGRMEAR